MARKLKDWLSAYMDYTSNSEPPVLFREWTGIGVIAACLMRKCFLPWEGTVYPNMYIVLTSPSGVARKGTAMRQGGTFLRELGIKLAADCPTRQALIKAIEGAETIDTHGGVSVPHCSLTIFADELAVFLGFQEREFISWLCDWFDCKDKWDYETKTSGENYITNMWVNLVGGTTPDLLRDMLPSGVIASGLASRMIFVFELDKGKDVAFPSLSHTDDSERQILLHDLSEIRVMCGQYRWTAEWAEKWGPWYLTNSRANPFDMEQFSGYSSRRATHLLKLCMILSASRTGDLIIESEDFVRALSLLEATEAKMGDVFRGFGKSDLDDATSKIMHFVARRGKVDVAAIHKKFYHDADSRTVNAVIRQMVEMKFCKMDITTSGGTLLTYIPEETAPNKPEANDPSPRKS